jgi:hypothetical protein
MADTAATKVQFAGQMIEKMTNASVLLNDIYIDLRGYSIPFDESPVGQ